MSINRADQHDEDKLKRWLSALLEESSNDFPIYALFLVSESDQYAHDIFRGFRRQFEQSGAGFQHLVILGQHGISKSELGLLRSLKLLPEWVPCLIVFVAGDPTLFKRIKLPGGACDNQFYWKTPRAWDVVLAGVVATSKQSDWDVTDFSNCPHGSVKELLEDVLDNL